MVTDWLITAACFSTLCKLIPNVLYDQAAIFWFEMSSKKFNVLCDKRRVAFDIKAAERNSRMFSLVTTWLSSWGCQYDTTAHCVCIASLAQKRSQLIKSNVAILSFQSIEGAGQTHIFLATFLTKTGKRSWNVSTDCRQKYIDTDQAKLKWTKWGC